MDADTAYHTGVSLEIEAKEEDWCYSDVQRGSPVSLALNLLGRLG